jgi:tRNA threonylcarbamoyladenosine biosynthesis protein TsaE
VLIGGVTIGLVGPLGSGKTQLVKGIAVGNSIDDVRKVTSPTFTLVHEHPGTLRLYHVDAYRLSGARELAALGFEEFARPDSAVVVEWADRVRSVMPEDALWIELTPTGETSRTLTFCATGDMGGRVLDALQKARR